MNAGIIASTFAIPFAYDADFEANVLQVAIDNSFYLPSTNILKQANALMLAYKANGTFATRDTLTLFAWNDVNCDELSLIDWKRNGVLYTISGGMVYTVKGWEGNALDGYINTNFNISAGTNYALNNCSRGYELYKAPSSIANSANALDGLVGSTTYNSSRYQNGTSIFSNSSAALSANTITSVVADYLINRTSSNDVNVTVNTTNNVRTQASSALISENQHISRRATNYGNGGFTYYQMGASMDDTVFQSNRTARAAYYAAIGLTI